jgi:uncharacterized surface protein with fasciclin (FAS1) repeats
MYPTKNIIENGVNSKVHATLVAGVKTAGLVDILEQPVIHAVDTVCCPNRPRRAGQ